MNRNKFKLFNVTLMMSLILIGVVVILIGCAGTGTLTPAATPAADYVLTNGKVYTVNPEQPWAEVVAVKGDTIVYVGDKAGAAAFVGSNTKQIDLGGRMLLPGFVESHVHVGLGAAAASGVSFNFSDTLEDALGKIKAFAEEHTEREAIFGTGYNPQIFGEQGPDKALLDAIVPARPVVLLDVGLHGAWVNSKALEVAGITRDTPDVTGGEYVRDANGDATGAINGGPASLPVVAATRAITAESMNGPLTTVLEGLTEHGFTTAMDMGVPIEPDAAFEALIELDKAGKLPMRLSMTHYINTAELAESAAEELDRWASGHKSDRFWFDTLKITVDSVIELMTAAMLEPYPATGNRGMLYFDAEAVTEMVIAVAEKGYHVTTHSYGDWAVRETLDAAENLRKAGYDETIFSITHTQFVHPADRPRFAELGVAVSTTGVWIIDAGAVGEEAVGKERWNTLQFPLRDWLDSGVTVALGSDWPATIGGYEYGLNPFPNIFMAMYRRPPHHLNDAVWGGVLTTPLPPAHQVMTLEEAIESQTLAGARILGVEDMIGSIEVGKKADLVLIDQNLFEIDPEKIADTKVLVTMFDGMIIHDRVFGIGDSNLVDPEAMDMGQLDDVHCIDIGH